MLTITFDNLKKPAFMIQWTHTGTTALAAFLASLVEFVEALTIILAVGVSRGWRWSLLGAGSGIFALTCLVLALGPLFNSGVTVGGFVS